MKKGLLIVMLCGLQFSCKKEKVFAGKGDIIGVDHRQCPCVLSCPCACGGLIFRFTDGTDPSSIIIDNGTIFQLPENTIYPVHVKINWKNTTRCGIGSIKITDYKIY